MAVASTMKQQALILMVSGTSMCGFEPLDSTPPSSTDLRRIGKVRMTWEESVSLWAEEGESQKGRLKMEGLSFLNADELTFPDPIMASCSMEAFEDGPLTGYSVDRFLCGQQLKIFGRRKFSSSAPAAVPPPLHSLEYVDRSDNYISRLKAPPTTLPTLLDLSSHLQNPPSENLRIPLRRDLYRDLPQGKDLFFTPSTIHSQPLDCRAIALDIIGPLIRPTTTTTPSSRDSFIPIWDDCINRIISKFSALDLLIVRHPSPADPKSIQDHWPNVAGFVRDLCLWRGEETDAVRENGHSFDPWSTVTEKMLWTYGDLPYVLGYYAVGYSVTFCALTRSSDDRARIIRSDLYTFDLSGP